MGIEKAKSVLICVNLCPIYEGELDAIRRSNEHGRGFVHRL
jgi:hypothetical protein